MRLPKRLENQPDPYASIYEEAPAPVTGLREPSVGEMTVINALAPDTLTPEQIYVFDCIVSSDGLNAYNMRMMESSLANFQADGQAGNPLLVGHFSDALPVGRSFAARGEQIDGINCVVLSDYMPRNYRVGSIETDRLADGIRMGLNTDMSIGWGGSNCRLICSICGKNMSDPKVCPHVPGIEYDGITAEGLIEDAHMIEHSIVTSGADPSAMILKARSMAASGALSASDISGLEGRWGVKLLGSNAIPAEEAGERTDTMNGKAWLKTLRSLFSRNTNLDAKLGEIESSLSDEATVDTAAGRVQSLVEADLVKIDLADSLSALGIDSLEKAKALQADAASVKEVKEALIAETLSEAIRAEGEKFNSELWTRTLAGASLADLRVFKARFLAEATERLGAGGRQTTPQNPAGNPLAGVPTDLKDPKALRMLAFDTLSAEQKQIVLGDFGK